MKSVFRFTLSWLMLSIALIGCIIAIVSTGFEGIFVTDVSAFGEMRFPSEREWEQLIDEKKSEIYDGSKEIEFLNSCFRGGWERCFENFVSEFQPWNYEEVLSSRPEFLSGNMADTDRIAGNEGWKRASEVIAYELRSNSKETVRNRIRFFNRKIFAVAVIMSFLIGWLIFEPVRRTRMPHKQCE